MPFRALPLQIILNPGVLGGMLPPRWNGGPTYRVPLTSRLPYKPPPSRRTEDDSSASSQLLLALGLTNKNRCLSLKKW
ncbi:hypothetical protein F5X98DRAFT_320342 [Xylaria grammica]|nr:hypothetical protein F5X98DRAFT_320342 [Xylaria grammica]